MLHHVNQDIGPLKGIYYYRHMLTVEAPNLFLSGLVDSLSAVELLDTFLVHRLVNDIDVMHLLLIDGHSVPEDRSYLSG